jgi:hypothetical protein
MAGFDEIDPADARLAWPASACHDLMDDGRPTDVQRSQEASPNWRKEFDSFENARARVPGKLHALIS